MISAQIKALMTFVILLMLISCERQEVRLTTEAPILFHKQIGTETFHRHRALKNGGFAVCGVVEESAFFFVIDKNGGQQFYERVDGDKYEQFYDAIETSDGGYLVTGITNSSERNPQNGTFEAFAVKFSSSGAVEWDSTYHRPFHWSGSKLIELNDGHYMMMGTFQNTKLDGQNDLFFVKLDQNGVPVWERTYGLVKKGHQVDAAAIGVDGTLLISAQTTPDTNDAYYNGRYAHTLLALNPSNGDSLWAKSFFEYTKGNRYAKLTDNVPQTLIPENDGYLFGQFYEDDTNRRSAQLIKYDLAGNEQWEKKYYGAEEMACRSVTKAADGGYLLTGQSDGKACVIKTSSTGEQKWISYVGGELSGAFGYRAHDDGNEILVLGSSGGSFIIYKLDQQGQIIKD